MGFSLNPISLIKQELLKAGAQKGKTPPVIEGLEEAEKGCEILGAFFGKFSSEDIDLVVSFIPAPIKALILSKVPLADLLAVKAGVLAMPAVLIKLDAELKQAEAELQS